SPLSALHSFPTRRSSDLAVVYFDNQSSRRYTILEINAGDALGLLYRISRLISHQGCDVDLVLISTEGKKAIDVFHITKDGAKLRSEEHTSELQSPYDLVC